MSLENKTIYMEDFESDFQYKGTVLRLVVDLLKVVLLSSVVLQ